MNIIELIEAKRGQFSRGQNAIADFIIDNIDKVCFMSLKVFAESCSTTPVSVLRFAKKLGLDNYINLKKELQSFAANKLTPNEKLSTAIVHAGELENAIQEVWQMDMSNMKRTYDMLNTEDIIEAACILRDCGRAHLVANNISRGIAQLLHSRLNAVSICTDLFSMATPGFIATRLTMLKPDDAVILITFPRYTQEVIFIGEQAKKIGCKVILITDSDPSSIARVADVVLRSSTDTTIFYNSYSSAMVIANVLTSVVALQMGDRFTKLREQRGEIAGTMERFLNQNDLFKEIP